MDFSFHIYFFISVQKYIIQNIFFYNLMVVLEVFSITSNEGIDFFKRQNLSADLTDKAPDCCGKLCALR